MTNATNQKVETIKAAAGLVSAISNEFCEGRITKSAFLGIVETAENVIHGSILPDEVQAEIGREATAGIAWDVAAIHKYAVEVSTSLRSVEAGYLIGQRARNTLAIVEKIEKKENANQADLFDGIGSRVFSPQVFTFKAGTGEVDAFHVDPQGFTAFASDLGIGPASPAGGVLRSFDLILADGRVATFSIWSIDREDGEVKSWTYRAAGFTRKAIIFND